MAVEPSFQQSRHNGVKLLATGPQRFPRGRKDSCPGRPILRQVKPHFRRAPMVPLLRVVKISLTLSHKSNLCGRPRRSLPPTGDPEWPVGSFPNHGVGQGQVKTAASAVPAATSIGRRSALLWRYIGLGPGSRFPERSFRRHCRFRTRSCQSEKRDRYIPRLPSSPRPVRFSHRAR